ncbi:MAG: class II aldolase [Candidatus Pacebacteria bacterium]|nr:class II aldolase [Candidatus Paceibacterota bacterium]
MDNNFKQMAEISQKIGAYPEYIQGGGGNVSVKKTDTEMAIKASGFKLKDLREDTGFVSVNHIKIKSFYDTIKGDENLAELMKENSEVVSENTLYEEGKTSLRPSIETGFHSLLGKCVVHTHSVYANILNCSIEGQSLIKELFPEAVFVPYSPPGVALTLGVKNAIAGASPRIIFLENHGLIVSGEISQDAYKLHEEVNARIKEKLKIDVTYPIVSIKKVGEKRFVSDTSYIKQFIQDNRMVVENMSKTVLFPDQVVYGESVGFGSESTADIAIDLDSGAVRYKTSHGEAETFEEIFVSWAFIIENIKRLGLTLKTISEEESAFVSNMESEKYRKKII